MVVTSSVGGNDGTLRVAAGDILNVRHNDSWRYINQFGEGSLYRA